MAQKKNGQPLHVTPESSVVESGVTQCVCPVRSISYLLPQPLFFTIYSQEQALFIYLFIYFFFVTFFRLAEGNARVTSEQQVTHDGKGVSHAPRYPRTPE